MLTKENKNYFEYLGRVYMPYTYWRRHIAPWRAKLEHKSYYPTYREYCEYYRLAAEDGYMPYGYFTNNDREELWIKLLDGLRSQAGLPELTPQEERESLDKRHIVCYT